MIKKPLRIHAKSLSDALAPSKKKLPAKKNPFDTVMHHGSQCPRCVATDTVRGIMPSKRLQPLQLAEWQLRLLSRLYYAM